VTRINSGFAGQVRVEYIINNRTQDGCYHHDYYPKKFVRHFHLRILSNANHGGDNEPENSYNKQNDYPFRESWQTKSVHKQGFIKYNKK